MRSVKIPRKPSRSLMVTFACGIIKSCAFKSLQLLENAFWNVCELQTLRRFPENEIFSNNEIGNGRLNPRVARLRDITSWDFCSFGNTYALFKYEILRVMRTHWNNRFRLPSYVRNNATRWLSVCGRWFIRRFGCSYKERMTYLHFILFIKLSGSFLNNILIHSKCFNRNFLLI